MTVEEAQGVWRPLMERDEGWLDTQARVERTRQLTDREREAADVLFVGFIEAMQKMSDAFQRPLLTK